MKKLAFIPLFLCSLLFISCAGEQANSESSSEETTVTEEASDDLEGMTQTDLSEYDIAASIHIPDGSKEKVELTATDWGSVEVRAGKRYGIEIVPYGMTITEKKEELAGDLVYTIEYIKDDADCIIYKRSIPDSGAEEEVHFFLNIELDGEMYEIKSLNDQVFSEIAIEKMISSAKSLTTIKDDII